VTKQSNLKMMDYIDFTVYQTNKRLKTQEQSDTLWYAMLDNQQVKRDNYCLDAEGNAHWRVEVSLGDYRTEAESLSFVCQQMRC
jgi:hypothetical protein